MLLCCIGSAEASRERVKNNRKRAKRERKTKSHNDTRTSHSRILSRYYTTHHPLSLTLSPHLYSHSPFVSHDGSLLERQLTRRHTQGDCKQHTAHDNDNTDNSTQDSQHDALAYNSNQQRASSVSVLLARHRSDRSRDTRQTRVRHSYSTLQHTCAAYISGANERNETQHHCRAAATAASTRTTDRSAATTRGRETVHHRTHQVEWSR